MNFKLKEFFVYCTSGNSIDEYTFNKMYRTPEVSEEDKGAFLDWIDKNDVKILTGRGMIVFESPEKKLKEFVDDLSDTEIKDVLDNSHNIDVKKGARRILDERQKVKRDFHTNTIYSAFNSEHLSGWLSPQGEFFECNWGEHENWAGDIVIKNEILRKERKNFRIEGGSDYYKDFLIQRKNYCLLDNPSNDGHLSISFKTGRLSKAQKEWFTDYFISRNDNETLEELLKY